MENSTLGGGTSLGLSPTMDRIFETLGAPFFATIDFALAAPAAALATAVLGIAIATVVALL